MDFNLYHLINQLAGRWPIVDELWRFVANDYVVPTVLVALLVALWLEGNERARQTVVQAVVALLLANLLVKLCNLVWFRPRPFTYNDVTVLFYYPSDSSFPSNSAAAMWAIAGALWLGTGGRWRARVALALAALMALGRVWVGIHYPMDVIGGALLGIAAAWLVRRATWLVAPLERGLTALARRLSLT